MGRIFEFIVVDINLVRNNFFFYFINNVRFFFKKKNGMEKRVRELIFVSYVLLY